MSRQTRFDRASLRAQFHRHPFAKGKSSARFSRPRRLGVERLEDRRLLAITVNSLIDELDGSIIDGDISLRDALLASAPFETIDFDASLTAGGPASLGLSLGELRITKSVTIQGPGSGLLTINGSGNDPTPNVDNGDGNRVFNINDGSAFTVLDVKINGLTLTGGDVAGDGGGIRNFETLTIAQTSINGNSSGRDGGGIFSTGSLTTIGSTVSGNRAARDGGGIYSSHAYLTLNNCQISSNTALRDGGGVLHRADDSELIVTGGSFNGNMAGGDAGGLLHATGNARITDAVFAGNHAGSSAGGISSISATLRLTNTDFTSNRANGGEGGGVLIQDGAMSFEDGLISDNFAAIAGGGIHGLSSNVTTNNSLVHSNDSAGAGGGIGIKDGTLAINDSTISGNSAVSNGGGLYAQDSNLNIAQTTLIQNSAQNGGSIWSRGGELNLLEVTASQNLAGTNGGGVFSIEGNLSIESSTISGNSAIRGGGLSVYALANQTAHIAHSTIAFNVSQAYSYSTPFGAGIVTGASTVQLDHTIVANNRRSGNVPDDLVGRATARFSLIGVNTGALITDLGGNKIGIPTMPIDARLEPLDDNGGPTMTHALLGNSPAVDAGDPTATAGGSAPLFDQRGTDFQRILNGDGLFDPRIDIGAFEVVPATLSGHKWHDLDADGVKDENEPGLAGWTIFLDENSNGQFDTDPITFHSLNVPREAAPSTSLVSTIAVTDMVTIEDLNLTLDISQPNAGNLTVLLYSPDGSFQLLINSFSTVGSNFSNTTLDDEAAQSIAAGAAPFTGNFRPVGPLSVFDDENPNGTWTLQIFNSDPTNNLTLNSWSLSFASSERSTITDSAGNYSFGLLAPGTYFVGEVLKPGWQQTAPDEVVTILPSLNANHAAITALVPNRFDFFEGEAGTNINDGGNDMYDGGNFLNTNRLSQIPYTAGVLVPGTTPFGPGSQYFTAKYPGMFVMGATNISINSFNISGNAGADGGGTAFPSVFSLNVGGDPYTAYVKRTFNAFDPSINQIIIVPGNGAGITQSAPANTDDDFHSVTGLSSINEIYYLLVARENGLFLEDADVLAIANAFLSSVGASRVHVVELRSGEETTGIDFGNHSFPGSIQGTKWHDVNGNGQRDESELGLVGWTIYVDENGNGVLDTLQRIEPDGYPRGTVLTNLLPGVTLTVPELPGVNVIAGISANSASTGSQVFSWGQGAQWGGDRNLRIDFASPTDFVAIDAVSDSASEKGALTAFDVDNNILGVVTTTSMAAGKWQTLYFARESSDIAYVIVGAASPSTPIHLDNFRHGAAEQMDITGVDGGYSFTDLVTGEYLVGEISPPGWTQTSPDPKSRIFERLKLGHGEITSLVPNRYDFTEGETGSLIVDGGNNMFDGGNILNTNRAAAIPYTNGVLTSSTAFGPDSEYFTAKFPGLFVLAATDVSINSFSISGNLGANGLGQIFGSVLHRTVDGKEFTVVVRQVFNAGTPSVNQIVVVPGNVATITPNFGSNTDEDFLVVLGMASVKEFAYALVSTNGGQFLTNANLVAVVDQLIRIVTSGAQLIEVGSAQNVIGVDFGNVGPPILPGDYNMDGTVNAADFTVWRNSSGQQNVRPYSGADGNGDGAITFADFLLLKENYGQSAPGSGTSAMRELQIAPQPASAATILVDLPVVTSDTLLLEERLHEEQPGDQLVVPQKRELTSFAEIGNTSSKQQPANASLKRISLKANLNDSALLLFLANSDRTDDDVAAGGRRTEALATRNGKRDLESRVKACDEVFAGLQPMTP